MLRADAVSAAVRSLGSEGRKGNPAEEIPPNYEVVYDFIVFKAADVINLEVSSKRVG